MLWFSFRKCCNIHFFLLIKCRNDQGNLCPGLGKCQGTFLVRTQILLTPTSHVLCVIARVIALQLQQMSMAQKISMSLPKKHSYYGTSGPLLRHCLGSTQKISWSLPRQCIRNFLVTAYVLPRQCVGKFYTIALLGLVLSSAQEFSQELPRYCLGSDWVILYYRTYGPLPRQCVGKFLGTSQVLPRQRIGNFILWHFWATARVLPRQGLGNFLVTFQVLPIFQSLHRD